MPVLDRLSRHELRGFAHMLLYQTKNRRMRGLVFVKQEDLLHSMYGFSHREVASLQTEDAIYGFIRIFKRFASDKDTMGQVSPREAQLWIPDLSSVSLPHDHPPGR